MIVLWIGKLMEKSVVLTPQEIVSVWGGAHSRDNTHEDKSSSLFWQIGVSVEVDAVETYDYLCYGIVDYEEVHNRRYDAFR